MRWWGVRVPLSSLRQRQLLFANNDRFIANKAPHAFICFVLAQSLLKRCTQSLASMGGDTSINIAGNCVRNVGVNRPGFRGGCFVLVRQQPIWLPDSVHIVPQTRPVAYFQLAPAGADG